MKILNLLKNTLINFYHSLKRFPIPITFSTAMAIILIIISEIRFNAGYNNPAIEPLSKIVMVLFLGFLLSLCIKLLFERLDHCSNMTKFIVYAIGLATLILYYFFMLKKLETVTISRFIALCFALTLSFLFIPSLSQKDRIELHTIRIFTRFFITIVYSIVLFLGLSAIIFTLNKLLNIPIRYNLYYYTWLVTAGVFAPIFFLTGVPASDENLTRDEYPKFFKILILYIVMPLITIYLGILYIYFAKILITQTWPIGLVSHLVIWYSAICVAVIFLISPIIDNVWVTKFIFVFPKAILPILVMMFTSMGIRIRSYGLTENRYYVVVLGLWILFTMIYVSVRKVSKNIVLPISLAIITVLSVIGPLSSFTLSKRSQNNRLTHILSKNQMIFENQIQPKGDIPEEDQKEISRILSYFKHTHSLKDVKYIDDSFELFKMKDVFGFGYKDNPYTREEQYLSYHVNKTSTPVDIIGYDYLFDFRMIPQSMNKDNLTIKYVYEESSIKIQQDNREIYSFSLSDLANNLQEKHPGGRSVPQADMIFTDENEYLKVKFVFSYINGFKDNTNNKLQIDGSEFYLLLTLK